MTSFHTGQAVQSQGVKWCDIQVGDLVWVKNKQPFPADVVVLCSSEDEHIAYIETSPIDGETNLKLRRAIDVPEIVGLQLGPDIAMERCENLRGQIECDPPNMNINSFTGTYTSNGQTIPIDNENVIYRGSLLRNTKWIIGLAVYTGEDTKLQVSTTGSVLHHPVVVSTDHTLVSPSVTEKRSSCSIQDVKD